MGVSMLRHHLKKGIIAEIIAVVLLLVFAACFTAAKNSWDMVWLQNTLAPTAGVRGIANTEKEEDTNEGKKDFIKWVDFNATYEALSTAYQMDVETWGSKTHVSWIELLAYAAVKSGGSFRGNMVKLIRDTKEEIAAGSTTMEKLTENLKNYDYYREVYETVLKGYVGEYKETVTGEDGKRKIEKKYGLKAFSPIAQGFYYGDYDDFGVSRGYGYRRKHLGHDMMGQIGTPIIAVEGGTVEALGWNQYGGWRIGIRSKDKKRYYYYAHLRQNRPYAKELKEGDEVKAGAVIGYMGHTGYSKKENTNNIDSVHLHFGIQLIFDESQKEGNGEIWIDCYSLTKFLLKNKQEVVKNEETKEWSAVAFRE